MLRVDERRLEKAMLAGLTTRMAATWHIDKRTAKRLLDAWEADAGQRGLQRADDLYWREIDAYVLGNSRESGADLRAASVSLSEQVHKPGESERWLRDKARASQADQGLSAPAAHRA